jgi:hypothetical protein
MMARSLSDEAKDHPACPFERLSLFFVSRNVARNLRLPVVGIVPSSQFGESLIQLTAVPEVTVTEHCHFMSREYDVRATRQISKIYSIAKAPPPEFRT